MADIQALLKNILGKVYGRDVRQSIHDAIRQCYYDGKAGSIDLEARQALRVKADKTELDIERKRIDNIAKMPDGSTTADAEVFDIRVDVYGKEHTNAGAAVREQIRKVTSEIDSFCYGRINPDMWEIGGFSGGNPITAENRIRTNDYLCDDIFSVNGNGSMLFAIYAYEGDVYVGRWNGSNFIETEGTISYSDTYSMVYFRKNYPNYKFKLAGKRIDETVVTSADFETPVFYKNQFVPASGVIALMAGTKIMKQWDIATNVSAILTVDGTFFLVGSGIAPIYTADELPPWSSTEYISNIKKIIIQSDLNIASLTYYFYNDNPVTVIEERVDVPANVNYIVGTAFAGVELRHLNLALHNPALETLECVLTNNTKHCIYSIPSVVATDSIIEQVIACINDRYGSGNGYAVALFITDSTVLRDAVYAALDDISEDHGQLYNIGVIYCEKLGHDGYPSTWTSYMKKAIKEIVPYMGRHFETYRVNGGYQAVGITGLSNYDSVGVPSVYDVDAMTRIRIYDAETGRTTLREVNMSSYFSGKPSTNALEQLTNGFSCSGFVVWLYWRYFNENFGLGSVIHFYENRTEYGNNKLPLTEITRGELKPFDIMVMYTAEYGHMGIFLGYDVQGRIRMLNSTGAAGLTFGIWDETQPEESYKYYRFTKKGISSGMLVFE